jgi:hypothetical protein
MPSERASDGRHDAVDERRGIGEDERTGQIDSHLVAR